MRKVSFILTLFALMIFASDTYAQRRGGGGGQGGRPPRGGGGAQGGQAGQGGQQCQQGGGGTQMRAGGRRRNQNADNTEDTIEELTALMLRLDQNRDGVIARNEVPSQLLPRMTGADQNEDGVLNRLEQMAVIDRARILSGRPNVTGIGLTADIFTMLDKNKDTAISRTETPRQLQRLFRTIDTNNDGMINTDEQKAALYRIKGRLNPEKPRVKDPTL